MKNTDKYFTYLVYSLTLISLLLFGSIAIYRWPHADDFGFITILQNRSVLDYSWNTYKTMDARYFMPLMLVSLSIFKYLGFTLSMVIGSVNYLLSAYFTVRILNLKCNWNLSRREIVVMSTVMNFLIWVLSYDYLGDTLYWMCTTPYNLSIAVGLSWIYYYFKNKEHDYKIGFFIFTFIAASGAQMISLPIFAIVFLDLIFGRSKEKIVRKRLTLLSIFIFITIAISTISPGSFYQYSVHMHLDSYYAGSGQSKLKMYLLHFIDFSLDSLNGRLGKFIIFSFLQFLLLYSLRGYIFRKVSINFMALWKLENYKYIFVSFASLIIYWPTLLTGGRYYESFTYLFIIAIVIFISQITSIGALKSKMGFSKLVIISLYISMLFLYGRALHQSMILHDFIAKRDFITKSSNEKYLSLDAIDINSVTKAVRFHEIKENSSFYVNKNYADFFKKDSVKARTFLTLDQIDNSNE